MKLSVNLGVITSTNSAKPLECPVRDNFVTGILYSLDKVRILP